MAEILKYFCAMNLFLFLIIVPAKIRGGKPFFILFTFSSLLRTRSFILVMF